MRFGAVLRSRGARAGLVLPHPAVAGPAFAPATPPGAARPAAAAASVSSFSALTASTAPASMPPLTPAGGAPGALAAGGAGGGQAAARSRGPVRAIKFKHVRFNRMHARLTYESPALSIRSFGLVLDNRVYRNVEGGWTSVLNRCAGVSALCVVW
jgi:hypothetical protein